jgi:hypothetical protein
MSGRCLLVNQRGARVDECDWTTWRATSSPAGCGYRRQSASRWSIAVGKPSPPRLSQFVTSASTTQQ